MIRATQGKLAQSRKLAADVAAFLKRGGRIENVPRGASAVNPTTGVNENSNFAQRRGRAIKKAREYNRRKLLFEGAAG